MERRIKHRAEAKQHVLARIAKKPVRLTLLDLSVTGCKVSSEIHVLQLGSNVLINFSDAESIVGDVVWCSGQQAGVQFRRVLELESLARFVQHGDKQPDVEIWVRDRFGRRLALLPPMDG